MRGDAIRKTIRKVMDWVKLLLLIASCVYIAQYLKQCGHSAPEPTKRTVPVYDTIPYYHPVARDSVVVRYETHRLPLAETRRDTVIVVDSVEVSVPITQKEYRDSTYHVWISGYAANLDSIHTFNRHDYTIVALPPAKPKRWHLGITAGFAMTPKGLQPYIGGGITYSFKSF